MVSTVLEQPHGLSDGDCVRFAELQGAPALCEEGRLFSVQVTGRHSLVLAHTNPNPNPNPNPKAKPQPQPQPKPGDEPPQLRARAH